MQENKSGFFSEHSVG